MLNRFSLFPSASSSLFTFPISHFSLKVKSVSYVWLFEIPWTVPGSSVQGFSRQEYWSGLPFSFPEDLPDQGIKPASLASPALAGRFFIV